MGYEYDYGYSYDPDVINTAVGIASGIFIVITIISIILSILTIIGMWKIFTKAGKPGWASLIPIYNIVVMLEVTKLPMWYIALFFIPFANIVALFLIYIELAHKFGKSTGFGVLTVFFSPICLPILGLGSSTYLDNSNSNYNVNNNQFNNQPLQSNPMNNDSMDNQMNQGMPNSGVKFCSSCGSQVDINAEFCPNCGNKLN